MFVGYYDPNPKEPIKRKVEAALDIWVGKFPDAADLVLCNGSHVAELAADPVDGLLVRGVTFIPRHTLYVGVEDPPAEVGTR